MNFTFEDITENPIAKKISEQQLNEKYTLVTPTFGKKTPCVLTPRYIDMADKIKNLKVHADDTWVLSYPKTGTTWTQEMVWLICNNLDYKGAAETILDQRFPFMELSGIHDHPEHNTLSIVENTPPKRFIKSHLPQLLLPDELWTVKPKIVYIARKVKDVAVSFYHHFKLLQGYSGSLEDFAEAFLNDLIIFSPYHEHILDFYALRNESNILFLRYESMISDFETEVRRTIKFFDKSYSDEEIKKLCNHLSFKSMKENKSINKSDITQFTAPKEAKDGEKDFIRKGQVGGYKADLSQEMAERFDNWTKSKIKNPRLLSLFI